MRICSINNCDRKYLAKGLCRKHYTRVWAKGHIKQIQEYCQKNREIRNKRKKEWDEEHREYRRKYQREYRLINPRSRHYQDDIELQLAINNVKKRDKNTCQWYGCGLTHREAPIHVNHIFPISEYPELKHIERYMICYCANHHALFHRYRGDFYYKMISPSLSLNELKELEK